MSNFPFMEMMHHSLIVLLSVLLLPGCFQQDSYELIPKPKLHDPFPLPVLKAVSLPFDTNRPEFLASGDFTGNGTNDSLFVTVVTDQRERFDTLYALMNGDENSKMGVWQMWAYSARPEIVLSAGSSDIPPLKFTSKGCLSGISDCINVGNVDGVAGDDFVLSVYCPDYSNVTRVYLLAYAEKGWKIRCEWTSRETELMDPAVVHAKPWREDSIIVWAMDYEAEMHDTVVGLQESIKELSRFKITE